MNTTAVVRELKNQSCDFEWYPSTSEQINLVANDIKAILETHALSHQYRSTVRLLDVGSGDGRVLSTLGEALTCDEKSRDVKLFGIEKAPVHTNTYRNKGITLLGTEFNEINFISKSCDIAFVNSPYSDFSHWMSTLILQLNFKLLYAIMPERWENDQAIQNAIKMRDIKSCEVIATSDFFKAERQARAKVHIVRFAFNDFEEDKKDHELAMKSESRRNYYHRPLLGRDNKDPFQLFIENELGLKQTHSKTTNKFHEHIEKERIRKNMETEGTETYEIIASRGVLWALLDNYEKDLNHVLSEYKKISQLDSALLAELGVEYKSLREGLQEKLFGYRGVYWSLLFDHLDVLSSRLTSKNKQNLLNTLNSNALDFTHTNATYIISYAVEMANELIESSLIEVFKELTSEKSIKRCYVSNEHMYKDSWRHNHQSPNDHAKYTLDYRFVSSHWRNFSTHSWERGLSDDARRFTDDILVAFKLLGYDRFYLDNSYQNLRAGDKLIVRGHCPDGKLKDLLHIRFYKNGNRHILFNQDAMLRLNCTVSRILGWVRSKEEFEAETECKKPINNDVWHVSDGLKIQPSSILALTDKMAA